MFSMWQCYNCELLNYDYKQRCQACFEATKTLSPLQLIDFKQELLYHGYLRMINITNKIIPMDIINLGFEFYKVEMHKIDHSLSSMKQALSLHNFAFPFEKKGTRFKICERNQ